MGQEMTPLDKIISLKMPFAELMGVTFVEAGPERMVARMLVRGDLCTVNYTIHGGAVMALADSVGAAATVINLPAEAKGTTRSRARPISLAARRRGRPWSRPLRRFIADGAPRCGRRGSRPKMGSWWRW